MPENRHLHTYIGDGAYAFVADYRSLIFYTTDGITEQNRVEIDVGDIATLEIWLPQAIALARSAPATPNDGRGHG